MKQHKTALPSLFSVKNAVTFYHMEFGKKNYGGEWHDFPELLYIERGHHQVLVDGELFELTDGQAIIYAPNAYHIGAGTPSDAMVDIMSFETDLDGLLSLCNKVITLTDSQKRLISDIMEQGLLLFSPLPKGSEEKGMKALDGVSDIALMKLKNKIELLLLEISADCSVSANRTNLSSEELNNVRNYLLDNLHRTLSQEEISEHFSMSVSKLKRLCRERLGCGIITYFMTLKLGEAKRLICNSSMNFSEIAEALGFGSIHHFSKFFKEKTGLTPSEYARSVCKK